MSKMTFSTVMAFFAGLVLCHLVADRVPTPVSAMSAHGTEKKTAVTVPLDSGMEAVVTLDHVTCELVGYVLDRFSGKFLFQYGYNVAKDFPLQAGRTPGFIMVAGQANFRQFSGNERIADGVIYISEEDSGQVVAYAMPWNTQFRKSTTVAQSRTFIPLDIAKTRFADVR